MDQIELKVTKRDTLGKKVRFLRRQGLTPVHLLGHGIESASLQCDTTELQRVLAQAGRTRLVSLKLGKEKGPRNVVVRQVQKRPLTGEIIHVDFYQVRMEEKVRVNVPVILVGEAPALRDKENRLEQPLNTLTVECLPAQIPASIELDVSGLTEVEQAIRLKDIKLDKEITCLHDPELLIVKISLRPIERVEKPAAEAAEVGEAVPVAEEAKAEE